MNAIRVGTRGSALALRQAELVVEELRAAHPDLVVELIVFKPLGDRDKTRPLRELGGQGVFVREIEEALLTGTIDIAVHSLKDLSGTLPEGLVLGAVTRREDPRDVWISRHGRSLWELPRGAVVGTSSPRRAVQLRALRPDFRIVDLRGNIDTRLRKAAGAPYDAIVLAAVGLHRMRWDERITHYLAPEECLPMVGQGARAVEARADDAAILQLLAAIDDPATRLTTGAERAFLRRLGAGCRAAIAAYATLDGACLTIRGLLGDLDDAGFQRATLMGTVTTLAEAEALGAALAEDLLARRGDGGDEDGQTARRPDGQTGGRQGALAPSALRTQDSGLRTEGFGLVSLVGAGPGDPGLLTVRGLERLRAAEVVVYDRLLDPRLLDEAPAGAERVYVGKEPQRHALKQEEINALLVARGLAGKRVARLKGGDPFVFGRGGEEAEALAAAGVPFEVVPGITSAIAAPAYAGIPVTHRDLTSSFTVVTGHEDPTRAESRLDWDALARAGTLVFLMGVSNLPQLVARLRAHGRPAETPAAAIEWGTWSRQRVVTGTLATLHDAVVAAGIDSPATIVVGEVARLRERLRWFDDPARKPLLGKRVLVTRARAQASELSQALAALGAIPLELPAIRFAEPEDDAPLDAVLARLADYQWILFTSANGARRFFARLRDQGRDARALAGATLVAIGTGTARALAGEGLTADIVPERFVAEAVVERLASERLTGTRVLLPRAAEARDVLPRELERLGARVDVVPVYRTVQAPPDPAILRMLAAGEIDIVTFTSSSTVTNLLGLVEPAGGDPLGGALVACIGPITARTARERGLRVDLVAEEHSISGLVAALVAWARGERSPVSVADARLSADAQAPA